MNCNVQRFDSNANKKQEFRFLFSFWSARERFCASTNFSLFFCAHKKGKTKRHLGLLQKKSFNIFFSTTTTKTFWSEKPRIVSLKNFEATAGVHAYVNLMNMPCKPLLLLIIKFEQSILSGFSYESVLTSYVS